MTQARRSSQGGWWRSTALLAVLAAAAAWWPAAAGGEIRVAINGQALGFSGSAPTRLGGRVVVPMRGIFEALGATVQWEASTQAITAQRGETTVRMRIGNGEAQINDYRVHLDQPPVLLGGSTMVPLRFVGEALGARVDWDDARQMVSMAWGGAGRWGGPPPTRLSGVSGSVLCVNRPTAVRVGPGAGVGGTAGQVTTYWLGQNAVLTRRMALSPAAGNLPVFGPAAPLSLANLVPGEEVRLSLGAAGEVTQIDSQAYLTAVKVRSADGNRIVLDDWQGTALNIGPEMRYISRGGTPSAGADVRLGETVVLFVSPTGQAVYQVSASDADLKAAASGSTAPAAPLPDNVTRIATVRHNATRPLKEGAVLTVTVQGTPGAAGTYDLSTTPEGLPLAEDQNRPGTYTGTYRVRVGDNVLRRRITAHLVSQAGQEAVSQSADPVTLDTVRPRIVGTFPANGAALNVAQQNLTVYADDIGGSGIAGGTMEITNRGKMRRVNAVLTPPTAVGAVPPEGLSGPVSVKAAVVDAAGNTASATFAFTVGAPPGAITAMTHTALQPVVPGAAFAVEMRATPGGKAAFNLVDDQNREVMQDVPLPEVAVGRYRAAVRLPAGQTGQRLRVLGKFTGANAQRSTAVAAAPLTRAAQAVTVPVLTAPKADDQVTSPLVVRGQAAPNAVVEVSVRAEGTQVLLVLFTQAYREDLDTKQIQADARGNWATQPIALPRPRDTRDLKYTITVTQTNVAGQRSDPVTLAVTPK